VPRTIRDIAEAAGLSVTTVSHALSGRGRVAPATRERVARIADELGYTANVHAVRLVSGRSRTLAIQIAGFSSGDQSQFLPDTAYFMDVLNGAAAAGSQLGYQLVLMPYDADTAGMHPLAIDGAIIVDPAGDEPLAEVLTREGVPVVTAGRPVVGPTIHPWIDNNHGPVALRMLEHFATQGYRRPALMVTTARRSYVADIVEAYRGWCRDHDLRPTVVELAEPPDERAAARAAKRLLTHGERPDAVYATYDRLALGVLQQARKLSISVPDDLGLASAVDGDALRWSDPRITAVFLDAPEIGRAAVQLLVDLVEDREPASREVIVPARLAVRDSTKPRR
jgi:DNA-binding LacI/PurR family transcriptional regulator